MDARLDQGQNRNPTQDGEIVSAVAYEINGIIVPMLLCVCLRALERSYMVLRCTALCHMHDGMLSGRKSKP